MGNELPYGPSSNLLYEDNYRICEIIDNVESYYQYHFMVIFIKVRDDSRGHSCNAAGEDWFFLNPDD